MQDTAILIRAGSSGTPLFLTHDDHGALDYAIELAKHLDLDGPIYGLPVDPAGCQNMESLQGMASRMLRIIRSLQPSGPYRLAGWSHGGVLAYEIAVQLLGEDQSVDFLGLLDSYYGLNRDHCPNIDEKNYLCNQLDSKKLALLSASTDLETFEDNFLNIDFETLVERCKKMALISNTISAEMLKRQCDYFKHCLIAVAGYFAPSLKIPVHLLIAREEKEMDLVHGWDEVINEKNIRLITIPGTHESMMANSNLHILGQTLSAAIRESTGSSRGLTARYAPLVTLQTGRSGATPLFCVPGAGASIVSFTEFAGCIDKSWPIHGFQPRGLDGLQLPHATLPAIVDCYLQALQEACPRGPVHLLGHSFGGWIVFEMAHRLKAAGRRISSLTIIDSDVPNEGPHHHTHEDVLEKWLEIFELILRRPLGLNVANLARDPIATQLSLVHEKLALFGLMPRKSNPEVLRGPLFTFASALRAYYTPERIYEGPVHLAFADDPKLNAEENRKSQAEIVEGWQKVAPNLHTLHAPGNHMTALNLPHVETIARWVLAANQ